MSTLKVDNLQTTGGVGLYPARAWVNFNGTGTVAIRASGNVSSITDHGTGQYGANFSTNLSDGNYSCAWGNMGIYTEAAWGCCIHGSSSWTSAPLQYNSSGFRIVTGGKTNTSSVNDPYIQTLTAFR